MRQTELAAAAGGTLVLAAVSLLVAMPPAGAAPASASPVLGASSAAAHRPSPTDDLSGVLCATPTMCMAVGSRGSVFSSFTLAELWNGAAWSVVATPNPAGTESSTLNGVSCIGPRSCTAVGDYATARVSAALVERWNGIAWKVVPSPRPVTKNPATLGAVACTSAKACVAVGCVFNGNFGCVGTFAESWNGIRWAIDPMPPGGLSLSGVACTTPTSCLAVGFGFQNGSLALTERWDGHAWRVVPSPSPRHSRGSELLGISCADVRCIAVGSNIDQLGSVVNLAERWTGTRWTILPTPDPAGGQIRLSGVSCSRAAVCTAVGNYQTGLGTTLTLAESWNGIAWMIQSTPSPTRPGQLNRASS